MEYTDIELKNEKWKDIFGYDGMYQVSDLGRVRSLKFRKTRVMKGTKDKGGYLKVFLSKNGKRHNICVHRLVAYAFIPNSDKTKNEVNHIDECKQNNRVSNLEWCDRKYNMNYNDFYGKRITNYNEHKRNKLKDLYDQNLSYDENIDNFKANGVDCSRVTLWKIRKDLGLIN